MLPKIAMLGGGSKKNHIKIGRHEEAQLLRCPLCNPNRHFMEERGTISTKPCPHCKIHEVCI